MKTSQEAHAEIQQVRSRRAAYIIDKKFLIGMTVTQAQTYLKARAVKSRTVTLDGTPRPVTADCRCDRINLHVRNDKVEAAYVG